MVRNTLAADFDGRPLPTNRQIHVSHEWPPPSRWNSDCWHCCHPFTGMTHPLPTTYDEKLDLFTFTGCFCSWPCVKGYIRECGGQRQSDQFALVSFLIKRVYGSYKRCCEFKCAPPRQALKKFGGTLTIDKFRQHVPLLTREMLPNVFNKDLPIADYVISGSERDDSRIRHGGTVDEDALRIRRKEPERRHSNTLSRLLQGGQGA